MKFLIITLILFSTQAFSQSETFFDGTQVKTAEEEKLAKEYMHEGKAQKIYDEKCKIAEGSTLCTNTLDKSQQKLETLLPIASTVFSLVVGNMKLTKKKTAEGYDNAVKDRQGRITEAKSGSYNTGKERRQAMKKARNKDTVKQNTEDQTDYCGYIAQGVELGSQALRALNGKKTQKNLENTASESRQAQSLYALKDAHKNLRNSTRIQTYGWGATAGCYGVMALTSGNLIKDEKFYIKLGGSVMMGTFYHLKARYHSKKMDQLDGIAKSLPGVGACNPVTETSCFCAEETSKLSDPTNYMKYCVPQQLVRNNNQEGFPCISATGKADPNCNCKINNSCITNKIAGFGIDLGLNQHKVQGLVNNVKPFANGYYKGNLGEIGSKNLAYAKKALKKMKPLDTSKLNLSSNQKKMAKEFAKHGIPKSLAAHMAAASKGTGSSAFTASLNPNIQGIKKPNYNSNKKAVFAKGKRVRSKKSTSTYSNPFRRRKSARGSKGGVEVMNEYVAKAQREAEIRKDTSKPIFDIISYRYKMSTWKLFKDNIIKEETKDQK